MVQLWWINEIKKKNGVRDAGAFEFDGLTTFLQYSINHDFFTVLPTGIVTKDEGMVYFYNISGKLMMQLQVAAGQKISLQSGVYIAHFVSKKGVDIQKILI